MNYIFYIFWIDLKNCANDNKDTETGHFGVSILKKSKKYLKKLQHACLNLT